MTSIEDLAKSSSKALDEELARADFHEQKPGSRRFRAGGEGDTMLDVASMVSQIVPNQDWTVDFAIELSSMTVNGWLQHHSRDPGEEHRAAASRLSKLRPFDVDLQPFAAAPERMRAYAADWVNTLRETVDRLLPKIHTFEDFVATVADDRIWTVTFEASVAITAIKEGLDVALAQARARVRVLRQKGYAENVVRHFEALVRGFH